MSKLNTSIVRAVRDAGGDTGRIIGQSLRSLREATGMTPTSLARKLRINVADIELIERRGTADIRSLRSYVEALGATLRIEASFPATAELANGLGVAFDHETMDDNQLVFPIFGEEVFRPQRDVVLSIHPRYSSKIIDGQKTVELRRRFPVSAPRGTIAYIYSTSPERALVGRAVISDVLKMPVKDIWRQFGKSAHIKRADFDAYFNGLSEGYALQFTSARAFPRAIELSELRNRFGFEPPQSFIYANPALRKALRDEFADVSN